MTRADETASRFDVRSADATSLAVWVDGEGPPLVMVHGSLQDHTASGVFVDELRADVRTFSMDRRGFGASGDAGEYSIEREFEDVAAVVDAVAARTGGPVALWGHSYGANCAMGGAALTTNVHHLVLYEPSLGLAYPAGSIDGRPGSQPSLPCHANAEPKMAGPTGPASSTASQLRRSCARAPRAPPR